MLAFLPTSAISTCAFVSSRSSACSLLRHRRFHTQFATYIPRASMAGGQASDYDDVSGISRELDTGATVASDTTADIGGIDVAEDVAKNDGAQDDIADITADLVATTLRAKEVLSNVTVDLATTIEELGKIETKEELSSSTIEEAASKEELSNVTAVDGELAPAYGTSVRVFYSDKFLGHKSPRDHVECPERLQVIKGALETDDLLKGVLTWSKPSGIDITEGNERRKLVLECVQTVHNNPDYLEELEAISANPHGGMLDNDTYVSPGSYEIALLAVSSWLDAVDFALSTGPAWALARPPGHHATKATGMGFCLLSNAAIAAFYALRRGVENVAIMDFDVHRGNGTDHCVKNEPRIRFASTHEYPLYPGGGEAEEKGPLNTILNVPLVAGTTMTEYREIVAEKVLPFLTENKPGLMIISAGFDALDVDPLASVDLVPEDYEEIVKMTVDAMKEIVGHTRIVLGLEGGYNLGEDGISAAAKHATRGLLL